MLPALENNYGVLAAAIKDALHIDEPKRVVLTAYPVMSYDGSGASQKICASGTTGMDASPMFAFKPSIGTDTEKFAGELTEKMRAIAQSRLGWTWVDAHRQAYAPHGLCATGSEPSSTFALPRRIDGGGGPLATLEDLSGGTRSGGRAATRSSLSGFGGERHGLPTIVPWKPQGYSPNQFKPYAARTRWIRTPNDAFLIVNLHEDNKPLTVLSLTRLIAYSGAFHPTAEGHAVMAGAVVSEIRAKKILDEPHP